MLLLLLAAACAPLPADTDPAGGDTGDTGDTAADAPVPLPADCTAPAAPDDPLSERSSLEVTALEPGEPFMELVDVDLVGSRAYAVGQGGLLVADVDADGQLSAVHQDAGMGRYHRVEPVGDALALAHRDQGLTLRDVLAPGITGATLPGGGREGLAAVGDTLYVADRTRGVVVYRVAGPGALEEVGAAEGADATWELLAADGALYAADNTIGLGVYDLADPEAPAWLGAATGADGEPTVALDLDAADGFLYVAAGAAGVQVWDVTDPLAPAWVRAVPTGGAATAVAAGDGWLWVAENEAVSVFTLADPADPRPFARDATRQFALAIDAAGADAVVGDWGYLEAWRVDAAGAAPALDLAGGTFVIGDGEATLRLHNRGGAALTLAGATAAGAEVWADTAAVPPGEATTLTVRWSGAPPDTVCLATDDPDAPTVTLSLGAAPTPPLGEPAPDFVLPTLDGESVRLADALGHPVVLVYFATW